MSGYENYTATSGHYDRTRSAVGHEIWLGELLARLGDLADVRLLDAGCGTGNFTAALAPHVGRISVLDMNAGMLSKAREKVAAIGIADKVSLHEGELPDLPFDDGSLDAVMFNQVLHHLEPMGEWSFPRHRAAFREAARVLRPGGVILINTCSRWQMEEGYWYHALIPKGADIALKRTIGREDLRAALDAAGFDAISRTVPLDAVLQGDAYFDPEGPLDATWRAGDSVWAFADDDELARALETVEHHKAKGTMTAFFNEHDRMRERVGQAVFWVARKGG